MLKFLPLKNKLPVIIKTLARNYGADGLSLAALAAMLLWFCDDMIFFGKVPYFRDLGTYTYPLKFSLAASFRAGEIPLWDRHIASGFPLLAALQPAVFYPPSLAFYFFDFFDAIRFTFFIHYLIAATGAYFLCRWWKYPTYLSIVAATLFSVGGTTVSLSNLLNHFQTAAWLPWMILSWERALQIGSWRTFVVLLLVLLCAILGGSPELYLFSVGLLFLDGLRLRQHDPAVTLARVGGLLMAANFIVAALGMAQFLPTFELMSHSRRDQLIPFHEATAWSLDPASLLGIIFPDKEVDPTQPIGVRLFFTRELPFLLSHYLGVLSLVGLSAWFFLGSWKQRAAAFALLGGSLVIALGSHTPVYGFFFDLLPALRTVRFPEKFFFFTYAFLLFFICRGLFAYHHAADSQRRMLLAFVTFVLFLWVAVYAVLRSHPELLQRLEVTQVGDVSGIPSLAATHGAILFHLERQIAITLAVFLLLFCQTQKLLGLMLFRVGMVAVAMLDLGITNKPFQFVADPSLVATSKIPAPSFQTTGGRFFYYPPGESLHPSFVSVLGRPNYLKATALNTENLLPNTGVMYGVDYFQEIDALARQPYSDFLNFANLASPDRRIKLLRALNVRYVISFRKLTAAGLTLSRQLPEQYSWLYEVNDPVPRVYIVADTLLETQPAKITRILSSKEFDAAKMVIVDRPVSGRLQSDASSSAVITNYGNSSVTIKTAATGAGVLVLADSYYPGWKVFVDGREGKILRANHFFRAVELSAGEHEVRFEYAPWSFTAGLWISLLTLSLVVLATLAIAVKNAIALRSYSVLAQT